MISFSWFALFWFPWFNVISSRLCACGMFFVACCNQKIDVSRYRTVHGMANGDKTVTRKMTFSLEKLFPALFAHFLVPSSHRSSSLDHYFSCWFGLVKHGFAFGTSIFAAIFKSMSVCVCSFLIQSAHFACFDSLLFARASVFELLWSGFLIC